MDRKCRQEGIASGCRWASQSFESDIVVTSDPRGGERRSVQAQFELLLKVRDKLSATHTAINQIRELKRRADDWSARA